MTSSSYRPFRYLSHTRFRFSIDFTDLGVCPVTNSRKRYFCFTSWPFVFILCPFELTRHLQFPAGSGPPILCFGPTDPRLSFVSAAAACVQASVWPGFGHFVPVAASSLGRSRATCIALPGVPSRFSSSSPMPPEILAFAPLRINAAPSIAHSLSRSHSLWLFSLSYPP